MSLGILTLVVFLMILISVVLFFVALNECSAGLLFTSIVIFIVGICLLWFCENQYQYCKETSIKTYLETEIVNVERDGKVAQFVHYMKNGKLITVNISDEFGGFLIKAKKIKVTMHENGPSFWKIHFNDEFAILD